MRNICCLAILLLVNVVQGAQGSSMYAIAPTKAKLSFEDPFASGFIEVDAVRGREQAKFYLVSVSIRARGREFSFPSEIVNCVPDPNLNSVGLGFLPSEESILFMTLEFGEFVEEAESEYVLYRIDLDGGTVVIDHVSNEELLLVQ